MAVLGKQNLTRLELPSTAGLPEDQRASIVLNTAVTMEDLAGSEQYPSDIDKAIYGLSCLIIEWNFTDAAGQPAVVSFENVKKLGITDFAYLNKWFEETLKTVQAGISDEVKKN